MFRIGLKLWSTNEAYVADAVRFYENGLYDYIELFVVPGSYEKFSGLWKSLNIPYVIHAPHYSVGMNLSDEKKFDDNMKLAAEAFRYADFLEATTVIFHPGIAGDTQETARQLKMLHDERMVIENKPYYADNGLICNGYAPAEIEHIMQEAQVGFCLDIGHAIYSANAQALNQMAYLKQFIELKPQMFHLTDGDWHGTNDCHDHLGKGSFKLQEILTLLPSDHALSIESVHDFADSLVDFIDDVKFLRLHEKSIFIETVAAKEMSDELR